MIVAVIPVKDEPEIDEFEEEVAEWVDHVTVVDDSIGRPDKHLFGLNSLGDSLQLGLAAHAGSHRVVTLDAGWSHDPRYIQDLVAVDADVVVGSRFCPGGHHEGPWWRSLASRLYGRACAYTTGYKVRDWTSGYRAYSPAAIRAITSHELVSKRHACQAEFLQVCLDAGLTVREIPITYRVMPGSTMSWAAAREAVRLWWSFA